MAVWISAKNRLPEKNRVVNIRHCFSGNRYLGWLKEREDLWELLSKLETDEFRIIEGYLPTIDTEWCEMNSEI